MNPKDIKNIYDLVLFWQKESHKNYQENVANLQKVTDLECQLLRMGVKPCTMEGLAMSRWHNFQAFITPSTDGGVKNCKIVNLQK